MDYGQDGTSCSHSLWQNWVEGVWPSTSAHVIETLYRASSYSPHHGVEHHVLTAGYSLLQRIVILKCHDAHSQLSVMIYIYIYNSLYFKGQVSSKGMSMPLWQVQIQNGCGRVGQVSLFNCPKASWYRPELETSATPFTCKSCCKNVWRKMKKGNRRNSDNQRKQSPSIVWHFPFLQRLKRRTASAQRLSFTREDSDITCW